MSRRTERLPAVRGGPHAGRLILTLALLIVLAALVGFYGPTLV